MAHYKLIEPLGVGGMAAVLRAHDTQLERDVALKILPPEMAEQPDNVLRFHQEARSAAKLDHDNVARVFFYGEDQGLHFIAFELVEGDDLRTLIDRRGRLPVREIVPYIVQITAGLVHAYERNVVHRDIKPSNILITPDHKAKLVDMGLARIVDPQEDMRALTHSGVTLGTFDYISPEQALEPRDADVRSDIYSLGCTFYHALTGHPPVPCGTAAKKVHCHQYVPPLDPRQYVPDLPIQVAAVLDRMLAKDPADRYQNPGDLLHDLVTVARELGIVLAPDLSLSEDAPHPTALLNPLPPRSVNLVALAVAVAAVLALIFLLGQSPADKGSRDGSEERSGAQVAFQPQGGSPPRPLAPHPSQNPPPEKAGGGLDQGEGGRHAGDAVDREVWTPPRQATVHDLAEWAFSRRGARVIEIALDGDLDFSPRGRRNGQGLLIEAEEVIIRAKKPGSRPTLFFAYDGQVQEGATRAALTIRSRLSRIEGVRLVLDQRGGETSVSGIRYDGGGKHHIQNCEFLQTQADFHPVMRLASVFVNGEGARPEVLLSGCCFAGYRERGAREVIPGFPTSLAFRGITYGGQDALRVQGPARITAKNCAFAPHQAAVRLEGATDTRLQLSHCSMMMGKKGAAFDLAPGAGGRLEVEHSLFSYPDWPLSSEGAEGRTAQPPQSGGVLLRQAEPTGPLVYLGRHNVYHAVATFRESGGSTRGGRTWEEFVDWLASSPGSQDASLAGIDYPWAEAPLPLIARLESLRFALSFRPRASLEDLRDPQDRAERLIGVETLLGSALFPGGLPEIVPVPSRPPSSRELIVDPRVDDSNKHLYPKLERAILAARPGDTISLRVNGDLEVNPVRLNTKDLTDLTIRAYEGFRPVLVMGVSTDKDTTLFEVHNGSLNFEGVEFDIRSVRPFDSLTLVAFAGDGSCSFSRCLITLDRDMRGTALALARVSPFGEVMPSGKEPLRPQGDGPRISFTDTVVRGHGELLRSSTGRPFTLEATDSFVALDGSLLFVDLSPGGEGFAPGAQKGVVRLKQVTAYLGGHLVRIDARRNPRDIIPIHVEPDRCLFAPAPTGQALLHLEGIEPDRETLKDKLLLWKGGQNVYGPFTSLLDMPFHAAGGMGLVMSKDRWRTFTGEATSHFAVTPASSPRGIPFPQIDPSTLTLPEELGDFGADPSRLPRVPPDVPALPTGMQPND